MLLLLFLLNSCSDKAKLVIVLYHLAKTVFELIYLKGRFDILKLFTPHSKINPEFWLPSQLTSYVLPILNIFGHLLCTGLVKTLRRKML